MTTLFEKEFICAICGTESLHTVVGSTNSLGSPDLDTRPPEMQRSTIHLGILRCPACGYCSTDISQRKKDTQVVVESDHYRAILGNTELPERVASFMALSFELEQSNECIDAAWHAIRAAWICDDEKTLVYSKICRKMAIELFDRAKTKRQVPSEQLDLIDTITLDLMRRAELFQEASTLIDSLLSRQIDETLKRIIEYQGRLIRVKNTDAHTASEVLEADST